MGPGGDSDPLFQSGLVVVADKAWGQGVTEVSTKYWQALSFLYTASPSE